MNYWQMLNGMTSSEDARQQSKEGPMNDYKKIINQALADYLITNADDARRNGLTINNIRLAMQWPLDDCLIEIKRIADDGRTSSKLSSALMDAYESVTSAREHDSQQPQWPYAGAVLTGIYGATWGSSAAGPFVDFFANAGASAFAWSRMISGDKYKRIIYQKIEGYKLSSLMNIFKNKADSRERIITNLDVRENIPVEEFIERARAEAARIGNPTSELKQAIEEGANEAEALYRRDQNIQRDHPWFQYQETMLYASVYGVLLWSIMSGHDTLPGLQILAANLLVQRILQPLTDYLIDQQDLGTMPAPVSAAQSADPSVQPVAAPSPAQRSAPIHAPVMKVYYTHQIDKSLREQLAQQKQEFYRAIGQLSAKRDKVFIRRQLSEKIFKFTRSDLALLSTFVGQVIDEDRSGFTHRNGLLDTVTGQSLTEMQRVILKACREHGMTIVRELKGNSNIDLGERIDILEACRGMRLFTKHTNPTVLGGTSVTDSVQTISQMIADLQRQLGRRQMRAPYSLGTGAEATRRSGANVADGQTASDDQSEPERKDPLAEFRF